jgi:hypothetical protein
LPSRLTIAAKVRDQSVGEIGDEGGASPDGLAQADALRSMEGKLLGNCGYIARRGAPGEVLN